MSDATVTGQAKGRRYGSGSTKSRAISNTIFPDNNCLWCGHRYDTHGWVLDGDPKHYVLHLLACRECAVENDTHQVVCYLKPGLDDELVMGLGSKIVWNRSVQRTMNANSTFEDCLKGGACTAIKKNGQGCTYPAKKGHSEGLCKYHADWHDSGYTVTFKPRRDAVGSAA